MGVSQHVSCQTMDQIQKCISLWTTNSSWWYDTKSVFMMISSYGIPLICTISHYIATHWYHKCDLANHTGMIDGNIAGNRTKPSGDFGNVIDENFQLAGCQSIAPEIWCSENSENISTVCFSRFPCWRKHFIYNALHQPTKQQPGKAGGAAHWNIINGPEGTEYPILTRVKSASQITTVASFNQLDLITWQAKPCSWTCEDNRIVCWVGHRFSIVDCNPSWSVRLAHGRCGQHHP